MPIQTNGNIRILGNLDRFVDLDVVLQIQVPGITGNLITRAVSVVYQLLGVRIIAQRTEKRIGVRTVRAVRADANRMLMRLTEVQLKMIALELDAVHIVTVMIINEERCCIVVSQRVALAVGKGDRVCCRQRGRCHTDRLITNQLSNDLDGLVVVQIDIAIPVVPDLNAVKNLEMRALTASYVHTAALSASGIAIDIRGLAFAGAHGKGTIVNIHAAAIFGRVAVVVDPIEGDSANRTLGHRERTVADIHTAAIAGGRVAVDVAVVHGKAFV